MTTATQTEYKRATLYIRASVTEPFSHTMYKTKDEALVKLRELKAEFGEPRLSFVENEKADVLSFKFPNTSIIGRVVFSKTDLEEYVHCPSCSYVLKREEDDTSHCHGWHCQWVFDADNGIWRVNSITKEEL